MSQIPRLNRKLDLHWSSPQLPHLSSWGKVWFQTPVWIREVCHANVPWMIHFPTKTLVILEYWCFSLKALTPKSIIPPNSKPTNFPIYPTSKPIPKKLKIWAWIIKPLRRQIAWKLLRKTIVKSTVLWSGHHIWPPSLRVYYKPYTWRCENKIVSNNNFVKPFQKFK